jgi:hypothetical protein
MTDSVMIQELFRMIPADKRKLAAEVKRLTQENDRLKRELAWERRMRNIRVEYQDHFALSKSA